jgi:hypothetical protein
MVSPWRWSRVYGKGSVFYSKFGRTDEAWEDPDIWKVHLDDQVVVRDDAGEYPLACAAGSRQGTLSRFWRLMKVVLQG